MAGHRGLRSEHAVAAVVGIIQACPREFAAAVKKRCVDGDWAEAAAEEFMALFRSFKTESEPLLPTDPLEKLNRR